MCDKIAHVNKDIALYLVGKDEKEYPRMSVIEAISEAFNRHQSLYHEMPAFLLLGPTELDTLIDEIAKTNLFEANSPFSMFGMVVVPKCADGIDFSATYAVSKAVLLRTTNPGQGN